MEKINFAKQFAHRLRNAMLDAGFHSARSSLGISIQTLVEITGYSPQICRRYISGQAIPEPEKLLAIARKLCVAPGWLLFGDDAVPKVGVNNIVIGKKILHYIFHRAATIYNQTYVNEEIPDFLLDLVTNISQINVNEEEAKKIIDLSFSSIQHFQHLLKATQV